MAALRGYSYAKRVKEVNEIYDKYARLGVSNREIWRRYIWPNFGICEKTYYNYLSAENIAKSKIDDMQLTLF